jgi:hypothetical protein
MILMEERALFNGVDLEVRLSSDLSYLLRYADLVRYEDGKKTVRGRTTSYSFKSVEQLRYDFERDVRAAGGSLGENP